MAIAIKVPSPGESINEVTVSKWLKQVGDYVKLDEPLVELESEKATFEVNAEKAGVLTKQFAKEGDEIKVGDVIVEIDDTAKAPEGAAAPKAEAKKEVTAAPVAKEEKKVEAPKEAAPVSMDSDVHIAPLAKELMLEHGIKPAQVKGSGPNGRITRTDVLEAIVAKGGSGTWGPIPMPANSPQVKDEDIKTLVKWILAM
jgi:2-oxoglutarate dehydrogenase E2 component (dihydrolipoamide succinyltransferase)